MPSARVVGFFLLLLAVGCAVTGCVAPREPPKAGATPGGAVMVEPSAETRSGTVRDKADVRLEKPPLPGSAGEGLARTEAPPAKADAPALKAEPPAAKADALAPKTEVPAVKTPAKAPAYSAPAEKVAKKESTAPTPVKPPALDLASLEKRLKETSAIGVFTKLTLKNQVDDLLNRFRAYYEGRAKITLAELRQPYDLLILKVLALLQDGDAPLARAIADSREAIWGILADPARFKSL
jgi:hypothetical protein